MKLSTKQFCDRFEEIIKDSLEGKKKVDFIGSYGCTSIESAIGLFLMKIKTNKNGKIKGSIEDYLGLAEFEGTLSEEKIEFIKEYKKASKNALKGKIYYHGVKIYTIEEQNLYLPDVTVKPVLKYYFQEIGRKVRDEDVFKFLINCFFIYDWGPFCYPVNFYYGIWYAPKKVRRGVFWICEPPLKKKNF